MEDFNVIVSVENGEFGIKASGNMSNCLKGLILAVATLAETLKKDGVTDEEMEESIMEEYRRAVDFTKDQKDDLEISAEYTVERNKE